jgi:hypothetical protein
MTLNRSNHNIKQASGQQKPSSLPNFNMGNGCLFPFQLCSRVEERLQQQYYCGIAYSEAIMYLKWLRSNIVTKIYNR